jgi:hypothetical protein
MKKHDIELPRGWFIAHDGRPMAEEHMDAVQKSRNKLAKNAVKKALAMQQAMAEFRGEVDADFDAHMAFVFEQHGKKPGGKDGGLTVESMDGLAKVVRRVGGQLKFNEELQVAEQIVLEFVKRQRGSKVLKDMAYSVFKVNKEGLHDPEALSNFFSRNYDDEDWLKAKRIYQGSRYYVGKKPYLAFYTRETLDDDWQPIHLTLAKTIGIAPPKDGKESNAEGEEKS